MNCTEPAGALDSDLGTNLVERIIIKQDDPGLHDVKFRELQAVGVEKVLTEETAYFRTC